MDSKRLRPPPFPPRPNLGARPARRDAYREFSASELYCPKCKRAMPVREKLLLVLPSGELYDYLCSGCGTSLGDKKT